MSFPRISAFHFSKRITSAIRRSRKARVSVRPSLLSSSQTSKVEAYTPPSVILVAWIPNVDGNSTSAGLRITVPNTKVTMPSTQFGQETWSEFTSDISFVADTNDVMLIFEDMATAPTFTSGVIPTNLTPPA